MATIYEELRAKLGREPTPSEIRDECRRIIGEGYERAASEGKLPHQRKRGGRRGNKS